jgi:hypothetical protein
MPLSNLIRDTTLAWGRGSRTVPWICPRRHRRGIAFSKIAVSLPSPSWAACITNMDGRSSQLENGRQRGNAFFFADIRGRNSFATTQNVSFKAN